MRILVLLAPALLLSAVAARAQMRGGLVPMTIAFDLCLRPAAECPEPGDRVTLLLDSHAVETVMSDISVLIGSMTAGGVRANLTERPVRTFAPEALEAKLVAGALLHVRASYRLTGRQLFLQAVEPLEAAAEDAGGKATQP